MAFDRNSSAAWTTISLLICIIFLQVHVSQQRGVERVSDGRQKHSVAGHRDVFQEEIGTKMPRASFSHTSEVPVNVRRVC